LASTLDFHEKGYTPVGMSHRNYLHNTNDFRGCDREQIYVPEETVLRLLQSSCNNHEALVEILKLRWLKYTPSDIQLT